MAGSYLLPGIQVKDAVLEMKLGGRCIYISSFKTYTVTVAKNAPVIAMNADNRHNNILAVKIQVAQPVSCAECLAAIFEITNVVPVPDNAQRIGFTEFYYYFGGMSECGLQRA